MTAEIATPARATRRASRRRRVQYLITADEHSLAELEATLATLPLCAVGRVFIEVPETGDISVVSAPARLTRRLTPLAHWAGVWYAETKTAGIRPKLRRGRERSDEDHSISGSQRGQ